MHSAGEAIKGSDLVIYNPDSTGQGEVCFGGRHIMMGYLKNDKAT